MKKGTATVQRTLIWRKGGEWYYGEPKTARSRRTMPFPASVLSALLEHRRRQAAERLKAGASYHTLKRAKLSESFRLYDLRHSCATLLLTTNEHPKVVSERLGHANIILTLDTYSHVLPSMQQAASEKLESILFKKTGTQ